MIQSIKAQIEIINNCYENAVKAHENMVIIANEFKLEIRTIDKLFDDYHEVKMYYPINENLKDKLNESMKSFNYKHSETTIAGNEIISVFCYEL